MEYGAAALWLALSLAGLFVGLPGASALFPRLADRGASVALPLVLLLVFVVSYVFGRVSLVAAAALAVLLVVASAGVALRRGVGVDTDVYLETALVWTIAFLFLVAVRAVDPAITPAGGEKFLDFGLLQSVLRADALPVEDFWFAGEPVMYYFGGHLIVGQVVRLVETTPGVAYNIAVAGFYATYVTAAYGLAGNVAARDGTFARRAGVLGAFFVGFASNLFTPLRLLLRPLPDGLAESIARTLGVWNGRFPGGSRAALITDAEPFSMWDATGVIDGTINEMPLFAFTNGDLHAHMMAPAFTLLAATALFAWWQTPTSERRRRVALLFGVVPLVGGALAVVNTWSFPSVAGLTVLAVFFDDEATTTLVPEPLRARVASAGAVTREFVALGVALASGVAVALLGVLWSLPFWLANASGRTVAVLPDRSSLAELAVVHGGFLLPIALYFGYLAWARFDLSRRALATGTGLAVGSAVLGQLLGFAAVGLLAPFFVVGYLLRGRLVDAATDRPGADETLSSLPGFELVLVVAAIGLVFLVEFAFLDESAGSGRFNTVFKTYTQVWAFFAVGTAVALGRLLRLASVRAPSPRWPTFVKTLVVVLVLGLSVYGAIGMGLHFGQFATSAGTATLDGTQYVDRYHPGEARAIDWLAERSGTPTIVTAPGNAYEWSSAPSAYTGVPTVVGWQHHENGFGRSIETVRQRADDVDAIYEGDSDTQRALLAEYDVQYVYVGPVEHETYGDISVEELAAVTPVERLGEVTIYSVDQSALPER